MQMPVSLRSNILVFGVLFAGVIAQPALSRQREVDKPMPCPTDAPLLVGSEGIAGRFSALSGCADIRVIPQASPVALNDHEIGSYVVRETARDYEGQVETHDYYHRADLRTGDDAGPAPGDVRVSRDYTASGTPVVTISPLKDESRRQGPSGESGANRPSGATRQYVDVPPAHSPALAPRPAPTPYNVALAPAPAAAIGTQSERLLELRADRTTPFDREIAEVAKRQRVDPLLLHAVIKRESGYRPAVVSRAGAVGAMQMMPGTGRMLGLAPSHLRNPRANIEAGARLLRRLADVYKGNFELVLAAYNAGEGAVKKYGNRIPPYAETQAYVTAVLTEYRRLIGVAGIVMARPL